MRMILLSTQQLKEETRHTGTRSDLQLQAMGFCTFLVVLRMKTGQFSWETSSVLIRRRIHGRRCRLHLMETPPSHGPAWASPRLASCSTSSGGSTMSTTTATAALNITAKPRTSKRHSPTPKNTIEFLHPVTCHCDVQLRVRLLAL